ncbi:MAG: DUF5752 family protein [bacterium]|nr:DUF5752 family protein [bacterium]MDD5756888.1 DUF5752 family protein [bacterium]
MKVLVKAKEPFRFVTRLHLTELTGLKASTLKRMVSILKKVPGSCIYHHTHRFLQQHQHISPEPPNDFAYWVSNILVEEELGERLASIDVVQFTSIRQLREKIIQTIDSYLKAHPSASRRFAEPGDEFHFIKSVSFIVPTKYEVSDLAEFNNILKKITPDSVYFHIFESRLRLGKKENDFSNWLEHALLEKELAGKISRLDPYTHTMEELREAIIRLIEKEINSNG